MNSILPIILLSLLSVNTTYCQHRHGERLVVKQYLDAMLNPDWVALEELMHQDIVDYHPTVLEKPPQGKEELMASINASIRRKNRQWTVPGQLDQIPDGGTILGRKPENKKSAQLWQFTGHLPAAGI